MVETLVGKVALVSGSSRGIGAATCVELAIKGARIIVNYPPGFREQAEETLERIRATGASASQDAIAIEADLSTVEGPKTLVEKAIKIVGPRIDILINNAGVSAMCQTKDVELWRWEKQVNLNARGTFLLTQAVIPYLGKPSRIVSVSSVGARQAYAGAAVYNGTKSMIESFTRVWAIELGREYECTVNAVCPGPTEAYGFKHAPPEFLKGIQPLLDSTPVAPRMAQPEEIAFAIGFLCEPRAAWITGVCLGVNGGFFMS